MSSTPGHSARAHAIYSPSSSHRYIGSYPDYLGCTAAPSLEAQFPGGSTRAADEGTLCHEICEVKVRGCVLNERTAIETRKLLKELAKNELYDPEMDECSEAYKEYFKDIIAECRAKGEEPYVAVEQRLDLNEWLPDGFGTADGIIISGNKMWVIDYKHGKGVPVDAEHNTQLMLYALGAYRAYEMLYQIDTIQLTIFQPRIDHINYWECTAAELIAYGEKVKEIMKQVIAGGEYRPSEDACRFCRAKATCRARADKNLELMGFLPKKADTLTPEEISECLSKSKDIAQWVKDLEDYALAQVMNGKDIPGWKAVHGTSRRAFTNTDEAFKILQKHGYDKAVLYESKPITLTAAEKLVGKKEFAELLADYIEKPEGKPTLVMESDKREAINTVSNMFGGK